MSSCILGVIHQLITGGPHLVGFYGSTKSVISSLRLFLTIHFRGIEWMFSLHNVNAGLVKPQIVDRMGTHVAVCRVPLWSLCLRFHRPTIR